MKKTVLMSILFSCFLLGLTGCVNVNYVGEYYPAHQHGVRVYMRSEDVPANTYWVMGHATATLDDGDAIFLSGSALNEELHKKAQAVGADAILILSNERRKTGVVASQSSSSSYHERTKERGRTTYRNQPGRGTSAHKNKTDVYGYDSAHSSQSVHDVYTQIVEADFLKAK